LKTYKPLKVNIYDPKLTPSPENMYQFYQVLAKLAQKLTRSLKTAVISDSGKIKVLEEAISEKDFQNEVQFKDIATFNVKLQPAGEELIAFAESPLEYGRLVSKIVDLALVHLSGDYFKYSIFSPYIMERGEGYFDEALRKRIGIEDGRRYYRGVRVFDGIPHLIIDREIELRSWKNLLNELKVLALWWGTIKNKKIDFYDPPKEFINFVNWIFLNRRANVKAYSARPVYISEITWDYRADSKILEGNISPCDYHQQVQGIIIEDKMQPLVKWQMTTPEGAKKDLFHVPELLVVGHTFKDISMRVSKSQISQVFDILHPHCGDQLRRILEVNRKIDHILKTRFRSIYPSKLEFSVLPKVVNNNVTSSSVAIKFGNKETNIEPPFGINFYRKYSKTATFFKPIPETIKLLAVCEEKHLPFIENLKKELEVRNNSAVSISHLLEIDLETISPSFDLLVTVTDDGETIQKCKEIIINQFGIAHQNVTPKNAKEESIPQLVMQIALKLGGYPWVLKNPEKVMVLSIYSYRNPFTSLKWYLFNLMKPEGEIIFQSKPFGDELKFLTEIKSRIKDIDKLVVLSSFINQQFQEFLLENTGDLIPEIIFIQINQRDQLRLFSTFRPVIKSQRRRRPSTIFPIEAYEEVPEGSILRVAEDEYYLVTTASTKVGTYHRGCPNPIKLKILRSKGIFNIEKILRYILSLSLVSGTSGHETKLPAPLYYMKKYAGYVNEYGLPTNEKIFKTLFYV